MILIKRKILNIVIFQEVETGNFGNFCCWNQNSDHLNTLNPAAPVNPVGTLNAQSGWMAFSGQIFDQTNCNFDN